MAEGESEDSTPRTAGTRNGLRSIVGRLSCAYAGDDSVVQKRSLRDSETSRCLRRTVKVLRVNMSSI